MQSSTRSFIHSLNVLCIFDIPCTASVTELRFGCLLLGKRQVLAERERLLYSGGRQSGDKVVSCPRTNSEDSAWPWKFLKRKRGSTFSQSLRWGDHICCHFPLHADLSTPCNFSFLLSFLHLLFWKHLRHVGSYLPDQGSKLHPTSGSTES